MASIKLGELLLKANVIKEGQLKVALLEQQKWGGKLGDILVRMSLLSEDLLIRALSKQLNLPMANLSALESLSPLMKNRIPLKLAQEMSVIPIQLHDNGKTLVVAMSEPQNLAYLDKLRQVTGCRIVPQVAGSTAVNRAIERLYNSSSMVELELSDEEASLKLVDHLDRSVVRSTVPNLQLVDAKVIEPTFEPDAPSPAPGAPPISIEALRSLQQTHRVQARAVNALVDLLVEKGYFTREEYLAKIRK